MCGIFGLISGKNSGISLGLTRDIVNELFTLSEARGKESSGIAIKNFADKKIHVLKHSVPATQLMRSDEFQKFFSEAVLSVFNSQTEIISAPLALIAHARLVTNGTQENNNNNQPVIKDGAVAVHNGIITNVDKLWRNNPVLKREYEVDTEVMLGMVRNKIQNHSSVTGAVQSAFSEMQGTCTTCIMMRDRSTVVLATNNASLYYAYNEAKEIFLFASENFILNEAIKKLNLREKISVSDSIWSTPFSGISIDAVNFSIRHYSLHEQSNGASEPLATVSDEIINHSPDKPVDFGEVNRHFSLLSASPLRHQLEFNLDEINKLQRCSRCLLPETFPFIKYDDSVVCNYCHKYVLKKQGDREDEFIKLMEQYKGTDGKPDCIIPFSGGRDSSYGLHYIVHELKMHPVTYTYDWGMVTDLARRNIARICGKLGVENILISADIKKKRRNIKLNVEAWLHKPTLGMIPLFMAGDKQFFHYVNEVKKQTGIKLDIWSTNQLENTDFKVGFCGISPSFDKTRPDYLPFSSKFSLLLYYAKNFMTNPHYINASIGDTLTSFWAYYAAPRTHFYQLFDWIKWDEKKIEQTLINEYEWELSPDTITSWRIGDGTASFYNYIYYTVAGFSEFDTFRSNQIREGLISREEGLQYINQENRPRFQSMKWYLDTIGVDFEQAVKIINSISKLYRK